MEQNKTTSIDFEKESYYEEPTGLFYDLVRRLTYRDIFKKIRQFSILNPETILEIGSGSGFFLKYAEKIFPKAKLTAIEYDDRLHKRIRAHTKRAEILSENAENFDLSRKYDLIVSTHVIEHLFNPEKMIERCKEHLNPGGIAIITTPNTAGLGSRLHGENWGGIRDDHVSLKSLSEWESLVRQYGGRVMYSGSTFFSGVRIMRKIPFRLLNDLLLTLFGSLRWSYGEACILVWSIDE